MIVFKKSALLNSVIFCAFSFMFFVSLVGMQPSVLQTDFFQKIEAGDLDGIKALAKQGAINRDLCEAGVEKLRQLKSLVKKERDDKTEGSEKWKIKDALFNTYQELFTYLNSVGFDTLRIPKPQQRIFAFPTEPTGHSFSLPPSVAVSQISLEEIMMNVRSWSSNPPSELPTPSSTQTTSDIVTASTSSSSSLVYQVSATEIVGQELTSQSVTPLSVSSVSLSTDGTTLAVAPVAPISPTVLLTVATASSSLAPIPEAPHHQDQPVPGTIALTGAIASDSVQQAVPVVAPAQHSCDCCCMLVRTFFCTLAALFTHEKNTSVSR